MIKAGLYRHYKGAQYQVIDTVRHSETEEELVLYRALYGSKDLWVRPLAMFTRRRLSAWQASCSVCLRVSIILKAQAIDAFFLGHAYGS